MDGTVTISVEDFEKLRRCEKVINKVSKALGKCEFVDDMCDTVYFNPVLEAINALVEI